MLGVRPPEYWPRLSYLAHMLESDRFVIADTFQYSRQSFQNRTKLRTPQGWQWISVPLKGGQHGRPIRQVEIDDRSRWQRSHWRAFEYNYRSTPFFEFYEPDLRPIYEENYSHLADLTIATIELLRRFFFIDTPVVKSSELEGEPSSPGDVLACFPGEHLLSDETAHAHDLTVDPDACTFRFVEPVYRQNFEGFEPGMSALDLLFNYGPDAAQVIRESIREGRH